MRLVTFSALLLRISSVFGINRSCVPNTQFVRTGKVCYCNNVGRWNEASCLSVERRANCQLGQIISHGCNQCICQENGQMQCNNAACFEDSPSDKFAFRDHTTAPSGSFNKKNQSDLCTPFKSYYVNCSICVCPASGRFNEAHCAADSSCKQMQPSSSDVLLSANRNVCIPNVMYLFPCLHCLCSATGYFALDKCIETCHREQPTENIRRCLSRTFYRINCNVCWCPDNNIPNNKLCTRNQCNKNSKYQSLDTLKAVHAKCYPYTFRKPKCYFCSCNTRGYINNNACLELECLKVNGSRYDITKTSCSPGEMVPICVECFCLGNGMTNKSYCSSGCSYHSKLAILEQFLKDSATNRGLLNRDDIKKSTDDNEQCEPNSLYVDQGRYCLCPENGSTNFKLCTSVTDKVVTRKPKTFQLNHGSKFDLNQTCTSNSFVEIDCNTCYCGKDGKIDTKWCTYDDCDAKRTIQEIHKTQHIGKVSTTTLVNSTCAPGSISMIECNFCICPESGVVEERACTKNICSEVQNMTIDQAFICDPLEYYLVDCNVCLCPRDGIKNVAKCTKKICEKTFLRSDSCTAGQFFSMDCNVCVCPPNGDKSDKICTTHSCSELETPWQRIFKLSNNWIDNSVTKNSKRELELCYSGEEFEMGCEICVCTDVGLKSYATCTESRCEEMKVTNTSLKIPDHTLDTKHGDTKDKLDHVRPRRSNNVDCDKTEKTVLSTTTVARNVISTTPRGRRCTAGSMYIIECRQCICPYAGNINNFCRPLPKNMYCEQPYPPMNYEAMARRNKLKNGRTELPPPTGLVSSRTVYSCTRPGRVLDACFMCECGDALELVQEDCFQSEDDACVGERPSFLDTQNKVVVV